MAGEFQTVQLGELVELDTGFAFKSADFVDEGIRLARGDNVKRGHFEWGDKAKFWPDVTPELTRYQLEVSDVLIGMDGSRVGENWVRVSEADLPALLVQRVARLRAKPGNDQDFIWYLIANDQFVRYIKGVATGTSIPHISGTQIRAFEVPAPALSVQKQISAVLRSFDDKIELNRQMAMTLEEMARALFKSWFVDFDPVHAKAEGRDTGLPADIAALFPDSFDDEGLPKEWRQSTVGELFSIVAGNTPSTKQVAYWGGPHAWATPRDMSGLPGPLLTQTDRSLTEQGFNVCSSGEIPEMSLLMSSRAPIGYLAFNALPVSINQGIAAFVAKTLSPFYAWAWCHENMKLITSNANGSTFQEISKGVLRTIAMVEPSKTVHDAFVDIAETAFARIVQLAEETATLTSLRDESLPKLLSGELRVADAETMIAAA